MKTKKVPPSVCKTEDGGEIHLNMITHTATYHPSRDLSSGGAYG